MHANEIRRLALDVIAGDPFPMLATADGQFPRVRPVSPVRTENFTVWVASLRSSGKTTELDTNPNVELCYLTKEHDQVRITGVSIPVPERSVREEIWNANPLLKAYLKDIDNPEFMLYRIEPKRVRYMKEWALEYQEVEL
jgi:general stress protein 26